MAVLFALGGSYSAWGLEDQALLDVTLSQCIGIARKHNVGIRNAREDLKATQAAFRSAEADFIPMVDLSGRREYRNFDQEDQEKTEDQFGISLSQKIFTGGRFSLNGLLNRREGEIFGAEEYASDVQVEFRQPFLKGGGLWAPMVALRKARHALLRQQMSLKLQEQQLVLNVTSGYYGVLRDILIIKVRERALEGARNSLRRAVVNFRVDRAAEIDTLQARLQVSIAESGLIQSQETLIAAKEDLLLLMGLDADRELRLVGEADVEQIRFVPYTIGVEEAIRMAMEHRLELKQLDLQLEDARLSVIAARDARESQLDLFSTYGMNKTGDSFEAAMELTDPAWTFGFEFQMPLWNVRERQAHKQAVIEYRKWRNRAEEQKREIIQEVREVVRSVQTSQNQLYVLEQGLALARETYELRGISYEKGYSTITDFLRAQEDLTRTEQDYYSALMSYKINLVRLQKAMGTLEMDSIELDQDATVQ
jgi:outer membrane protein TolC